MIFDASEGHNPWASTVLFKSPWPFYVLISRVAMTQEELASEKGYLANRANELLSSQAHTFIISSETFVAQIWREPEPIADKEERALGPIRSRCIPASAIRLVLDWATNNFDMDLPTFLSGIFYGREWDKVTPPWRIIPEVQDRISAESMGLDHLYSKSSP